MKQQLSLLILAVLFGCATPSVPVIPMIPDEYHGIWVVEKGTCGLEGQRHDGDITITATELSFHAEPYRVKTLTERRDQLLVTYDPPEQTFMQAPAELYLSADKNMLSELWHRCPKQADE